MLDFLTNCGKREQKSSTYENIFLNTLNEVVQLI